MSYELPLARVYQQLETVSPAIASPDLPACIIGRCYHVQTYVANKSEIYAGEYDPTDVNTFLLPNNKAGAILEPDSAKLYFDDMYIELSAGTFNAADDSSEIEDLTADFETDEVEVGSKVVINHSSLVLPLERIVLEIVSATKIKINKNFTAAMTGATYSIRKKLDDRLMLSSNFSVDDDEVSVNAALTHLYNGTSYSVKEGKMYFEYKSLRMDLSTSIDDANSTSDIESKLGVISKENPLALGVKASRDNTVTPVSFIAVNSVDNDDLGWSNVKDILENNTSVYFLALLTAKQSIISSFKTHCELMATAEEHGWRVCSGGIALVTEKVVSGPSSTGEIFDNAGTLFFRDNSAEFMTSTAPADRLELDPAGTITGSYVVKTVVNDNVLEVTPENPLPSVGSAITYSVERDLSKTQQAEEIAATIDSHNSKRVVVVWPDEIEINSEVVDGYFLGAVIAGMVSGLPPHQGLTNLSIAGVDRLYHSNTYFNKEQLNKIAEAGGMIFVQETPSAAPYIRHQLTTDTQYVETRELSVVKNFDHLSYYFYDAIKDFIGPYNVTDKTVGLVLDTITLAAQRKMSEELPKIGAPLKGFTLDGGVSEISSDRVKAVNKLDLPKPLNYIDLYLVI